MKLDAQKVLADKSLLLLDFDGPVCSVFAGYPALQIAAELVESVRGFAPGLAATLRDEQDPMEVLRSCGAGLPIELVKAVDEQLNQAELRAVESAEPTPGATELIIYARQAGVTVSIVSNNGAGAIDKYLKDRELDSYVDSVWGRPFGAPERMKPDPFLLHQALSAAGIEAERACFVGDSVTDIEAGESAGIATVGYANKAGKAQRLRDAGATVVVATL